jgi:hypothetical protein
LGVVPTLNIGLALMRKILTALAIFTMASTLHAGTPRAAFDTGIANVMAKMNREAAAADGMSRLAVLIQAEYGTSIEELRWAVDREFSWGEIATFAYIQATNGRSFSELKDQQAAGNYWQYAEKAGMSTDKMLRSLEQFSKRVERERNSRIFEQMRNTRTVARTPDVGSGFGLFQDALDFRRIQDNPGPPKVYTGGPANLAKGDK